MSKCVILMANQTAEVNKSEYAKLQTIMLAKKVEFDEVDGSAEDKKDIRDKLFALGERGKYPQVFIRDGEDVYEFMGDFEKIQNMTEVSNMIKESPTMKAQFDAQGYKTFEEAFARAITA